MPIASRIICSILLLAGSASSTQAQVDAAETWANWRGPNGDGTAHENANPPITWSAEKNIAWKAELPGHGKSTPIVWGEQLYLIAAVPSGEADEEELAERKLFDQQMTEAPSHRVSFHALAFERKSGQLLWDREITERLPVAGVHKTNGYASSTPVTDGETLWVNLGSYGVHALDVENGNVRWSHELGPQHMRRGWGEASSPALAGKALIAVADQEGPSHVVALDKDSGKVLWRQEHEEVSTWNTPCVVEAGGVMQVVLNGTVAARSYDAESGELLWYCAGQTVNAIPTPITDGKQVVITSGYRGSSCMAFDLNGRGDLAESDALLWRHKGGTPYVPSPVRVDDRLYFTGANSPLLTCLDFRTGEVLLDKHRLELGSLYASPLAAAGRLYFVGRDGTTVVLRHDTEIEVLAVNSLDDPIDASPVAIDNTLYLRSESTLYAIRE